MIAETVIFIVLCNSNYYILSIAVT